MADEIRATPRNQLLGLLADAFGGVSDFTQHEHGTMPIKLLGGLLGLPSIAKTLDRMSYGESLGTGSGMTYRPSADTIDAAMAAIPLAGAMPGAINSGAAAIGRRLEPGVNALVNRTMAQGGRPAQLLQDMAQGTRSMIDNNRLPFLAEAELAYKKSIPPSMQDSQGQVWNLQGNDRVSGLLLENNGRRLNIPREPYAQFYQDPALRDAANRVYAAQAAKQDARALHAELMAPTSAPTPPWAQALTSPQNTQAADAAWWNAALKNKSDRNFDAFADAAKDGPLMYYGKGSQATAASDVASAYPGVIAKQNGSDLLFRNNNGSLMVMDANLENPVIRSTMAASQGKANGGGKELYQAAYNWAANNNKIIKPDSGLTDINELRKLGNVLSAQVRSGQPVADMNAGGLLGLQGVPQLWQAEAKLATKRAPEIKSITFDGQKFNLSDAEITNLLAQQDPGFARGVGAMTAKRAALAKWLKTASPDAAKAAAAALAAAGTGAVFAEPTN
jgi:hypothetical protein